jgi:hypothetical protein
MEFESANFTIIKPAVATQESISIGNVSVSEGSKAFVGVLQQGDLVLNFAKDGPNAHVSNIRYN